MIPKQFDQVTGEDLHELLKDSVSESKTLEYKLQLPDDSDKAKHAFMAAVASFANTDGGDLLYGIEAQDGIPVAIPGVGEVVADQLKLRLESMVRSGIEPRLPKFELRLVPAPAGGEVLLVRVAKSWTAPHRVTMRASGPFYGRHSSGKFEMDVAELRTAFNLSDSIEKRIGDFRGNRVEHIFSHRTPARIHVGCKMAVHIVPLSAFATREQIDMRRYSDQLSQFHALGRNQHQNSTINLEGVLNYANADAEGLYHAYTQVFRSGIVEAVQVFREDERGKRIHSIQYELHAWTAVQRYLGLLSQIEVSAPFYVFLSLVGLTGYSFVVPEGGLGSRSTTAEREIIALPEVVVTDPTLPASMLLRPAFDMVWNAFGYPASENFDAQGNWHD